MVTAISAWTAQIMICAPNATATAITFIHSMTASSCQASFVMVVKNPTLPQTIAIHACLAKITISVQHAIACV